MSFKILLGTTVFLLSSTSCGGAKESSRTAAPQATAAPETAPTTSTEPAPALADAAPPDAGVVITDEQLRLLMEDLPTHVDPEGRDPLDLCPELCMVNAVCSEKLTGEDYSGGSRCVDDCENWGGEGPGLLLTCLRGAPDCESAVQCFESE